MFGIKRKKQSQQADNTMKESGSAAVLELKCAVAVMPSGDGSAEYRNKGVVTVTDDDRLVLQTKRETMELHLKDVRLYSKANAQGKRKRRAAAAAVGALSAVVSQFARQGGVLRYVSKKAAERAEGAGNAGGRYRRHPADRASRERHGRRCAAAHYDPSLLRRAK